MSLGEGEGGIIADLLYKMPPVWPHFGQAELGWYTDMQQNHEVSSLITRNCQAGWFW
jgi:hypothetical protein